MKFVVAAIIVIGLSLGGWQFYKYYGTFVDKPQATAAPEPVPVSGEQLPGLPPPLQSELQMAEDHGAAALNAFLRAHANEIKDPRRAWIELDYVVLVGESNPAEARLVFSKVKARLDSSSPVYPRMKQLEKTYGQ